MKKVSKEAFYESIGPRDIVIPRSRIQFGKSGECTTYFETRQRRTVGMVKDTRGIPSEYYLHD